LLKDSVWYSLSVGIAQYPVLGYGLHEKCRGDSFCELCYEYHTTHSSLRKTVHNERYIVDSHRAS
jgi:hypothetical protein